MKRLRAEWGTVLMIEDLLALLSGQKGVLIDKLGEEHDGVQMVLRFTLAGDRVQLKVKEWHWDHGGDLTQKRAEG